MAFSFLLYSKISSSPSFLHSPFLLRFVSSSTFQSFLAYSTLRFSSPLCFKQHVPVFPAYSNEIPLGIARLNSIISKLVVGSIIISEALGFPNWIGRNWHVSNKKTTCNIYTTTEFPLISQSWIHESNGSIWNRWSSKCFFPTCLRKHICVHLYRINYETNISPISSLSLK